MNPLRWSLEATVADGQRMVSAFQLGTYVVQLEMPDGAIRTRVLPPGLAIEHPDLPGDEAYEQELRDKFAAQTTLVYIEG